MNALSRVHDVLVFDHVKLGSDQKISELRSEDFKLIRLIGLMSKQVEFSHFNDTPSKNIKLVEALQDCGEWLGLFHNQLKDYVVCADYYGYSSIFYALIKTHDQYYKLVISNSFRGIAYYLATDACDLTLNWPCVLPHLITNTNIFLTRASNHTFANEIQVLNYNEVLLLKNGRLYVVPRKKIRQQTNLQSYETLLYQGVEAAVSYFSSWVKQTHLNVCFNLSGGKDSRVVLAMLLQSEYKDQLKVFTVDPENLAAGASKDILMKDFDIASKIVQHYGLNWFKRTNYREINLSYDEQLNIWQDFRSNSSFEIKPKNKQVKDCKELRLTGIGGELIRSYLGNAYKQNLPNWWAKAQNIAEVRKNLRLLFEELCNPWLIDTELYAEAMAHFIDSFMFNENNNVLAQLDESYLAYRNRAHAGVAAVHHFEGALLKYPLCQTQFKQASHLLDPFEEENGKVLYDIIKLTQPELNTLEFAAPKWPDAFQTPPDTIWQKQQNNQAIARYEELMKANSNVIEDNPEYVYGINEADAALFKLNANLEFIAQRSGRVTQFNQIIQRIARLSQQSTLMLHALVAKTESILDVLLPNPVNSRILTVDLESNHISIEDKGITENIDLFSVLKKIDLSRCTVELEITESQHLATVKFQYIPMDCEIAIYIYENGQKVAAEWYKKMNSFSYEFSHMGVHHIRMMVFIRRMGEPEAQRIINVEKTF